MPVFSQGLTYVKRPEFVGRHPVRRGTCPIASAGRRLDPSDREYKTTLVKIPVSREILRLCILS
jgi:hypothetical protein